jgi:hypothetical protein
LEFGLPLVFAAPSLWLDPYFISIIIVCIVFGILLAVSSSFRKYRRRKNILAYCIFFLVVVMLAFQIGTYWNPAFVDFGLKIDGSTRAYLGKTNEILLYGQSLRYKAADFYVVLRAENASLLIPNEQDYVQLDNRTVKVFFSLTELHKSGDNGTKPVYYTIDKDSATFRFSTSLESKQEIHYTSIRNRIEFAWNITEQCYLPGAGSGFQ